MNKFGRQYRLKISSGDQELIVTNPITIQFTVQRKMFGGLNEFNADLYNLEENVRNFLFNEEWVDQDKEVTFEAGYDTLSTLFIGNIWNGTSYREGADIITSIQCKSKIWELNNSTVYETINSGQTLGDIIKTLAGGYRGIEVGAIGDFPEVVHRPRVLNGNRWEVLKKYSNNLAFIDNGRIFVLKKNEVIEGEYIYISPENGLLATPKRENMNLNVQMLFEPRIVMNQTVELDAQVQSVYDGAYKVCSIQHMGIISDAVGGDCRTVLDLYVDGQTFKTVPMNG